MRSKVLILTLVALLTFSLAAPMAVGATSANDSLEFGDERAELDIEQPSWVDDDLSVDRTDNRTIYEVSGDEFEVIVENANHSDVDRVDVVDGSADIEYDDHRDVWHVEPDGEGTVSLQFIADEPVLDSDGNETSETEETRYAATLRVSDTDWTHLETADHDETRQDAQNWSAVESEANSIAPERSVDSVLSTGFAAAQFLDSPGAALSTDIQGVMLMLVLRPGGLVILSVFLLLIGVTAASGFRWRHRFESQLEEHDRAAQEMKEAWLNKSRKVLQQCEWSDLLPDHLAQTMYDMWGPNVWQGFKNYQLMRSPTHTKGLWLQMMGQIGYTGVVHYDADGNVTQARALTQNEYEDEYGGFDVGGSSDDPDDGSRPDVIDVDGGPTETDGGLLETEELARFRFEDLRFDDPEHRDIIDAIPVDDMDESVFLPSIDIDPEPLSLPIDNHNIDDAELVALLEPRIPGDFQTYEQMARVHGQLLEYVVTHPHYTDSDGQVREEMDLLSFMSEMDSVLADKAEFSAADIQRRMNYWVAEHMDRNDEVDHTLREAFEHGVGRSDERAADVIGPEDVDLGGSNPGGDVL